MEEEEIYDDDFECDFCKGMTAHEHNCPENSDYHGNGSQDLNCSLPIFSISNPRTNG